LPFFVAAGLALINWMYGYFVLPESLPPEKRGKSDFSRANPLATLNRLRAYPLVAGLAVAFCCMSLAQRGLENVWVLFTSNKFGWTERTNGLTLGLVGVMAAIVQGGLVRPVIARLGERRAMLMGLTVSTVAFACYGLAPYGWMIPCIIVFGSFGGITGPAVQSIVTGTVDPTEQGAIQGALTSLMSLTNIAAPLLFTWGLFSYFTSERAVIYLPGTPFLVGSLLWLTALLIARRVLRRTDRRAADASPTHG
jgi:DHA1 family tetracycline resistance protein-like MFS transporter